MIALRLVLLAAPLAATSAAAPPLRDCPDCPALQAIPGGSFAMGSALGNYEQPEDTGETPPVTITVRSPFLIAATEVTVRQFARFVAATGFRPSAHCRVWTGGRWTTATDADWHGDPGSVKLRDDLPVTCVGWADARAYASWLSTVTGKHYRLPSEAEWEYAARGGVAAPRYWGWNSFEGVSISDACDNANVYDVTASRVFGFAWPYARCADGYSALAPVATFKPNAYGLYDMIGNAWEWTQDCFTASYVNRPPDSRAWEWSGGCEERVMRGGGWASRPLQARATNRGHGDPGYASRDVGFRIARDADAAPVTP